MKSLSASLNKTTLAGRDRGATPRDKLLSTSRAGEINATTEVKNLWCFKSKTYTPLSVHCLLSFANPSALSSGARRRSWISPQEWNKRYFAEWLHYKLDFTSVNWRLPRFVNFNRQGAVPCNSSVSWRKSLIIPISPKKWIPMTTQKSTTGF